MGAVGLIYCGVVSGAAPEKTTPTDLCTRLATPAALVAVGTRLHGLASRALVSEPAAPTLLVLLRDHALGRNAAANPACQSSELRESPATYP